MEKMFNINRSPDIKNESGGKINKEILLKIEKFKKDEKFLEAKGLLQENIKNAIINFKNRNI